MNDKILRNTLKALRAQDIVDFDISKIEIEGKPVFRMGTKPRNEMPQLRGFPKAKTVAARIPVDDKGKVDVTKEFLRWIVEDGTVQVHTAKVPAASLSAAQDELVASKVARNVGKLKDSLHKKFTQAYIVSHDYVLLDGHHGWAAVVVNDIINGTATDLHIVRTSLSIDALLEKALLFTQVIGIEPKEGI